jgi:Fe2+ or Zn2+ uptake regulation protein
MMQRHHPHPPGTFLRCSCCMREPHHIVSHGPGRSHATNPTAPHVGERHHLECARCGRVTSRHATLVEAEAEWGIAYAQQQLPLRVVPTRRQAAA